MLWKDYFFAINVIYKMVITAMAIKMIPLNHDKSKAVFWTILFPRKQPNMTAKMPLIRESPKIRSATPAVIPTPTPKPTLSPSRPKAIVSGAAS